MASGPDECREHLATYEDEQLLAEWDEAVRRDLFDPDEMACLQLWDAVRSGQYWDSRRQKQQVATRTKPASYPTGRALAAERVRARLTQRALAAASDLSRDSITRIERNVRPMTFDEACRLADALKVPLDRFRPIE
jgi:hypothetical protein